MSAAVVSVGIDNVYPDQVKQAVMRLGTTFIPTSRCRVCMMMTGLVATNDRIYKNDLCDCAPAAPVEITWGAAADIINNISDPRRKIRQKQMFGFRVVDIKGNTIDDPFTIR